MAGRFLPFRSTWSFIPEFDCIFCVATGCRNAIMPVFANIVAPFDFEVETCIVYFTDIFSREVKPDVVGMEAFLRHKMLERLL